MRLSMDKNDPAYGDPRAIDAKVTLDGIEIKDCVTADEEAGECLCLKSGPDGRPIMGTEIRRGIVVIQMPLTA